MCMQSQYPIGHQLREDGAKVRETPSSECADAQPKGHLLPSFHQSKNFAMMLMAFTYLGRHGTAWPDLYAFDLEFLSDHIWIIHVLLSIFLLHWQWETARELTGTTSQRLFQGYKSSEALQRLSHVSSRESLTRLSTSIRNTISTSCSPRSRVAVPAITSNTCFAKSDYIDKLSADDVTTLFTYAGSINQENFDRAQFVADQTDLVRAMITAIDLAVSLSRGSGATVHKSTNDSRSGEMDVLYFVAVTRVYAEWRNVRLVPAGHKSYAVSMKLAYKDLMKNLIKIEGSVHSYLKLQHQSPGTKRVAPTFRQLLQYEIDTNVHPSLPKLSDASGANGLLWTKRQLHYQSASLRNILQVPTVYMGPKEAAMSAYNEVYKDYHGWAVKQLFNSSFGGTPPLKKIWERAIPPATPLKRHSHARTLSSEKIFPLPERQLSDVSSDDEQSNKNREDHIDVLVLGFLDNVGSQIAEGWENFLRHFNCGNMEEKRKRSNLVSSAESYLNLKSMSIARDERLFENAQVFREPSLEDIKENDSIGPNTLCEVKNELFHHVEKMGSLLDDISEIIEELNMNDPSRV